MLPPATRNWPRYVGALLLMVLLFAGGATAASLVYLDGIVDTDTPVDPFFAEADTKAKRALDEVESGKPQTLLLIGSDKRSKKSADGKMGAAETARADTMMLVRLDAEQGAIAVLSIPRDTKAEIPQKNGGVRVSKINEAYSDGGPELTIQTVRRLLDVPIHHYVVTQFGAFSRGVNRLGCLYQDVDRTYFNDNSQGGPRYAEIDIKSGYQRLCGEDTLSWVRYRHTDSDFVRGARQQDFLRSAKSQITASQLLDERDKLLRIFHTYSQTDIRSPAAILSLVKLAVNSREQPVRSVKFRGDTNESDSYVTITDSNLATMRREFLRLTDSKGPAADTTAVEKVRKQSRKRQVKKAGLAAGLIRTPDDRNRPEFTEAEFDLAAGDLPLYFPSVRLAKGGYTEVDPVRSYNIVSRTKKRYPSYRLSFYYGEFGQYWGVQGTTWRTPPILAETHTKVERRGRKLQLYKSGGRYRMIAWRTDAGVYWVSNTLSNRLTNAQMLDIASNLRRASG